MPPYRNGLLNASGQLEIATKNSFYVVGTEDKGDIYHL
jgi:hypothetical protein